MLEGVRSSPELAGTRAVLLPEATRGRQSSNRDFLWSRTAWWKGVCAGLWIRETQPLTLAGGDLGIELDKGHSLNCLDFPQRGCISCRIINKLKRMRKRVFLKTF